MKTKSFLSIIILFSLMIILNSCKKSNEDENTPTPPPISYGTPTAVGTPVGAPNSATLDASGGTLVSADGRMEIIIPTNALSAATAISIQPISNTSPGGVGLSYYLSPHGQQFNQPITIRFHYDSTDVLGTSVYALGIAYQKADNIWYSFNDAITDSLAGTESITTTHFSGYSMYKTLFISPKNAEIAVETATSLKVISVKKATDPDPNDELCPLLDVSDYAAPSQVSWTVNGNLQGNQNDGTVSPASGSISTTYTAPSSTSTMSSNPAMVGATVNVPGASKVYLISNVKVVGNIYIVDIDYDYSGGGIYGGLVDLHATDHASFKVTIGTNNIVDVSLIINNAGTFDNIIHTPCQMTNIPTSLNLLDITGVTGEINNPDELSLYISSNMIVPGCTMECTAGAAYPMPAYNQIMDYNILITINNGVQSVSEIFGEETLDVTITPQ